MALTTDDIVAIHQLYSEYCHAIDEGDGEAFGACFVPDGKLGSGGPALEGREALARFASKIPSRTPGVRHAVTNVHARGDGDRAEGRAYFVGYTALGGEVVVRTTGRYRDDLQRVDGTWLFVERRFTADA
jgi:uncharacterized protein (TIGR02246 family)